MMVAVVPNVWIRRPQVTARFARIFALCGCVFLLLALGGFLGYSDHRRPSLWLDFGVVNLVWGALAAALVRQYARRGIRISADGILVRNLLSTRRIALADADGFAPGVAAGLIGPCPILKRRTGEPVSVGGLARVAATWRISENLRELEPLCVELNKLLSEMQEHGEIASKPALPV